MSDKPAAATVPPKNVPAADKEGGAIRTSDRGTVGVNELGNLKEDKGGLILQAAKAKDLKKLKAAVEAGGDINQAHTDGDLKGMTAMHWAVLDTELETLDYLMDNGAYIDARDDWGQTPLHQACYGGQLEAVKLLVARGADINDRDWTWGQNSLHWASIKAHVPVMEWLIAEGMDVNAVDEDKGASALHLVAQNGSIDATHLLIEHGASASIEDQEHRKPEDQTGNEAIKDMLINARKQASAKKLRRSKRFKRLHIKGPENWTTDDVLEWLDCMDATDTLAHVFKPLEVTGSQLIREAKTLMGADPDLLGHMMKGLEDAKHQHQIVIDGLAANQAITNRTYMTYAFGALAAFLLIRLVYRQVFAEGEAKKKKEK